VPSQDLGIQQVVHGCDPTCCGLLPLPNQPPNQPLLPLPSPLPSPLLDAKPPSGACSSPSGEAPSGAAIGADGSGAGAAAIKQKVPSDGVLGDQVY
jgi:hypothetical protein